MQTTDPRRTPRPDSEERTQKPGAAVRPHPVTFTGCPQSFVSAVSSVSATVRSVFCTCQP